MYSIIIIDGVAIVIPSVCVRPTNIILAWNIVERKRAYEILDKIKDKRIKRKIDDREEQKL